MLTIWAVYEHLISLVQMLGFFGSIIYADCLATHREWTEISLFVTIKVEWVLLSSSALCFSLFLQESRTQKKKKKKTEFFVITYGWFSFFVLVFWQCVHWAKRFVPFFYKRQRFWKKPKNKIFFSSTVLPKSDHSFFTIMMPLVRLRLIYKQSHHHVLFSFWYFDNVCTGQKDLSLFSIRGRDFEKNQKTTYFSLRVEPVLLGQG